MKYDRVYNFSAGPAMMPEPVLEEIRDEMMNYQGSGMCVMEMSHRSKVFAKIHLERMPDIFTKGIVWIPFQFIGAFSHQRGSIMINGYDSRH